MTERKNTAHTVVQKWRIKVTRQEAIELLEDIKFNSSDYPRGVKALEMAIEALKREQQLLDAGRQNVTVDFYIGGRLFRAKEIAQ
jgi:hypothetical protein